MDGESIILDCVLMTADICLFGLCYKMYKYDTECLKSLQEAKQMEINNELPKTLRDAGGVIPYAVITGNVKALASPLRSHHFNYLQGVIYERITKERKLKWSPFLHIWDSFDSDVQKNAINIPFGLYGGSFFKKQIVEVIDPLASQELALSKVYGDFKSHKESVADILIGFSCGEHTIGTLEVEKMLLEDTLLTAVGKLTIENDKLKIMPPGDGLIYYLTPLSLDSLIERVKSYANFSKGLTIFMGTATLVLLAYLSKKAFAEIKRRIVHARQIKKLQKERLLRMKADDSRKRQLTDNSPKCVVCLENPVEVLILECGHICLCINCSEQSFTLCPVCRAEIQRLVPAFLP